VLVTSSLERAVAMHRARWGAPTIVARAPGRVNLIGEHTDYNDGFALPMALPFDTVIAMSSIGDPETGIVTVNSGGFGRVELDPTIDLSANSVPTWARHLAGVVAILRDEGIPTGGWSGTIETDIPTGASLSSSAALEVALITALLRRVDLSWSPIDIARLGQRVEHEVVGLPSGIMDQFISAGATESHASLMDCRSLTLTPVALPAGVLVAVMDTGTRRVLADAAYADRRASCERAAADIGVVSLRDASLEQLSAVAEEVDRRRARHVVTENARTTQAVGALRTNDVEQFGELMNDSHVSLRDDFEVSGPALNAIVEVANGAPGCLGARMTGGGFAGCAVALVREEFASAFSEWVVGKYVHEGHDATVWMCHPSAGASIVQAGAPTP
jgi:galactokinase